MSKSGGVLASRILFDGTPGLIVAPFKLQKAASLVSGAAAFAPVDLIIVSVPFRIKTVFTDASTVLDIGADDNTDAFLDGFVLTDVAAGMYDLVNETFVTKTIPAGTCFYASIPNVSGTTGLGYGCIIAKPAAGA